MSVGNQISQTRVLAFLKFCFNVEKNSSKETEKNVSSNNLLGCPKFSFNLLLGIHILRVYWENSIAM